MKMAFSSSSPSHSSLPLDQQLFWYLLLDEDGASFEKSTADYVVLHPLSFVAQLRDAVKQKNTVILSSFDSCQLRIYKDLQSFKVSRGKSGFMTSKEDGSLEVDSHLSGLGDSMKNALVVLVPIVNEERGA